jgi:hypothetical protein
MDELGLTTREFRFSFLHDTILTTFAGYHLDRAICVVDRNLISTRLYSLSLAFIT